MPNSDVAVEIQGSKNFRQSMPENPSVSFRNQSEEVNV